MQSSRPADTGPPVILDWMSNLTTLLPPVEFNSPSHNFDPVFGNMPLNVAPLSDHSSPTIDFFYNQDPK